MSEKLNDLDEIWAYDEPHPSGGYSHITMTKKQAIEWMRHIYGNIYDGKDEQAFQEWVTVNWAYPEPNKCICQEQNKIT